MMLNKFKFGVISMTLMGLPFTCRPPRPATPDTGKPAFSGTYAGNTVNPPTGKCDEGFDGMTSSNGSEQFVYKCKDGKLVLDPEASTEANREQQRYLDHQAALAQALTTRVLTAKEMDEVLQRGYQIFVVPMFPFREEEMQARFEAALRTQVLIRQMAAEKQKGCVDKTSEKDGGK